MLACTLLRGEKAALSGAFVALVGVLFSAYLSYLELFVLRAICQWCVASAVLVVAYLVLCVTCYYRTYVYGRRMGEWYADGKD
jgi:uncharacterized membrane protein